MKCYKKSDVYNVWQFTRENYIKHDIPNFIKNIGYYNNKYTGISIFMTSYNKEFCGVLKRIDGREVAINENDYIVVNRKGNVDVLSPNIFNSMFDKIK